MSKTAKKHDTIFVDRGQLSQRDQNYGLAVECYVCTAPHKALGVARIQYGEFTTHVPLCEPCLGAADTNAIVRKFWPDLKISEGGEATTEQVLAMAEKQDTTEH